MRGIEFVTVVLAAFGALCAMWVLLGWLLPAGRGSALVCWDVPDEGILTRFKWLKSLGFLNVPLLVIAQKAERLCPEAEICSGENLIARLEWERKRFDGTGNGDSPGCGQCRGVSEL